MNAGRPVHHWWRGPTRLPARALSAALALSVAGCASVSADLRTPANEELCRSYLVAEKVGDFEVEQERVKEMTARSLSRSDCSRMVGPSALQRTVVALGTTVLAGAVLYLAIRGLASGNTAGSSADHQWDWDLFFDERGQLTWACRGVQSGEFADLNRCHLKAKTDARWPSLQALR